MTQPPRLIVFSGLPGSGKSTLARRLAQHLGAAYLRIDSIEAALLNATGQAATVEGYAVAYALAADQLELGLNVLADCVNPLEVTRDAWAAVAAGASCPLVNIEVVCSDVAEHRRRVETRQADSANHAGRWQPPTPGRKYRPEQANINPGPLQEWCWTRRATRPTRCLRACWQNWTTERGPGALKRGRRN
ncbi:AAA family ATPase [Deinococcus radiomollis]|uniref:AAA family ATPase n=1 Tax=Deinococcus radiomollis TaxID=468916 RepID=UPI00389207E7